MYLAIEWVFFCQNTADKAGFHDPPVLLDTSAIQFLLFGFILPLSIATFFHHTVLRKGMIYWKSSLSERNAQKLQLLLNLTHYNYFKMDNKRHLWNNSKGFGFVVGMATWWTGNFNFTSRCRRLVNSQYKHWWYFYSYNLSLLKMNGSAVPLEMTDDVRDSYWNSESAF